jgi:hypothetical protein
MSLGGLGVYVKASTANPTGWRPWNSRLSAQGLSFYIPNTFPVPTTGRGPLLLQPGQNWAQPSQAGGLGDDTTIAVDPTLLLVGVGLLAVGLLLFSGRKAARRITGERRTRRRRKLQAKISRLQSQM